MGGGGGRIPLLRRSLHVLLGGGVELANVKQLEHFAIYRFNRCGKQRHKDGVKNMSGISGRHIYPHLLQDKGEAITVLSSLHGGGGGGGGGGRGG